LKACKKTIAPVRLKERQPKKRVQKKEDKRGENFWGGGHGRKEE